MGTIGVPDDLRDALVSLVEREGIPVEIVPPGEGVVEVVRTEARAESSTTTLQSGGCISCATAFAAAERLDVSLEQLGAMLDGLDVRVRRCQLGLFP